MSAAGCDVFDYMFVVSFFCLFIALLFQPLSDVWVLVLKCIPSSSRPPVLLPSSSLRLSSPVLRHSSTPRNSDIAQRAALRLEFESATPLGTIIVHDVGFGSLGKLRET